MFLIYFEVRYIGNSIAKVVGYQFEMFILPLLIFIVVTVFIFIVFRAKLNTKDITSMWWVILIGVFLSYLPTLAYIVAIEFLGASG